jgi:hypothetical protein
MKIKRKILFSILLVTLTLSFVTLPVLAESTIVDIAVGDPDNFSTLVAALSAAGLVDVLDGAGAFTVFAPTNDAFAALPEGTIDYLLENIDILTQVLTYHVVSGEAFSTDLSNGQSLTTLQGDSLTVSIGANVKINDATVVIPNVDASNGVIHVIDTVLVPQGLLDPDVATIQILSSIGGTTNPETGTYSYLQGTDITLTATPEEGFEFLYWVVSGAITPGATQGILNEFVIDDEVFIIPGTPQIEYLLVTENPAQITCGYGYTYKYQAVFSPIAAGMQPPEEVVFFDPFDAFQDPATPEGTTFVRVSATQGGTTNPSPGTWRFGDLIEPTLTLTATPNSGFKFQYWIVTGDYMPGHGGDPSLDTNLVTENPLTVSHGKGYSYNYEAVFAPTDMQTGGDSTHIFGLSSDMITILIAILVIALIAAIAFGIYIYTKK